MSKVTLNVGNMTYVIPNIAGWAFVKHRDESWQSLGSVRAPSPAVYIYLSSSKPVMETFKTNEDAEEFVGLLEDCVRNYWEGSTNA
jgi:hypothetical protein